MKQQPPSEVTLDQMTLEQKKVLMTLLEWKGKPLASCSRGDLYEAILHLTSQVVTLKELLDQSQKPFYEKTYWKNRFQWRGWSWLKVLNTLLSILFNRVLIREIEPSPAGLKFVGWIWKKGSDGGLHV